MIVTTAIEPSPATLSVTDSLPTPRRLAGFSSGLMAATVSWALAGWSGFVLLSSLPYKFSGHPATQHIFSTIGEWLGTTVNADLGATFSAVGAKGVGTIELITAIVLLLPALFWLYSKAVRRSVGLSRSLFHAVGGIMATSLMAGAAFFHLFTPLGVQVVVEGVSDGGSLFRSALSVLIAGLLLVALNHQVLLKR
ncbi:hypothetical protein [Granulosicoccus antarcticus]|uniref:Uncharacterized protein n=1 Tax=Granulosicoccus antarcticus IMCC3135 TaxID=1192854 RepID=A0A2Z2NUV9_9GAMM|nr:hypothetical protein [Granulosicoccus antarcticus]ASJ70884.1 hypothetical protein IMCC3135_03855 [Granulosicoccus antarcticus IMCC3135]